MSTTRRPQLHFTLLLLAYYCSTHIAANGGNGTTVQCLPDQAASLLQLKRSFYNPNLSSWQHGTDCCRWEGVGCNRASGQVITLDLGDRNLQSISGLSPALFNLTSLRNLSLSGNDFGLTSLPRFRFERLIELLSLNLSDTNLAGQIPIGISHLKNLRTLDSSYNIELYFNDPSFQMVVGNLSNLSNLKDWSITKELAMDRGHIHSSFSRLRYLEKIILSENSISGNVPQFLTDFSSLSTLDLRYNDFEGQFPTKIFHLEKLSLYGRIPIWINNLTNLSRLYLTRNNLQAKWPHTQIILQLTKLQGILLKSNKLEGTVELDLLSGLKYLKLLSLSDNMLSVIDGEYPFPSLPSMQYLYLASCNLTKIPSMLRHQYEMEDVDLSSNSIDGVIPCWLWENGKNSIRFNLSHNMFTTLEKCTPLNPIIRSLGFLDLSSNRLEGNLRIPLISRIFGGVLLVYSNNSFSSITPAVDIPINGSIKLDLSKNKLNGHIPTSICGANHEMLELSYNNLTGPVPSCLIQHGYVKMLKLRNNQLDGMLPGNIGEGCMLQTIDLNSNRIEGKIPRSLSNCRSLEVLDIGNNHIVDSFPTWLGVLSSLRVLILRSNQFYGSIGSLTKGVAARIFFSRMQIIDLASNNFSGNLHPEWFEKLETMMSNSTSEGDVLAFQRIGSSNKLYQDSMVVTFKGSDLTFTKILTTFKMLDFSNNAFDGPIPDSVGNLIALHGLNIFT
uniref:LRR receptor-like serine/threonine-protein kinase RCH1 n=1 Tax=Aegilops tauschii TaxID=37682 RepID=M8B4U2_AEGTA